MRRVILIVMDGCGVGAMPDAGGYGDYDSMSATLPHVADAVCGLHLPTLERLGLGSVARIAGVSAENAMGAWGKSAVASTGKDSIAGHWEMMGVVTEKPHPLYPLGFPSDVIARFEHAIGRKLLGNRPASGTEIIRDLGPRHVETGSPIVYTSADSVFQVAAHEDVIPVEDLYEMCLQARRILVAPNDVQRVIARPFVGSGPSSYQRTERRRDFPVSLPPHNLLHALARQHQAVHAIGVVADLFPADLFIRSERSQTNAESLAAIDRAMESAQASLIFANCEDFDMRYGHRNDPAGFAKALTEFDTGLKKIVDAMQGGDLLIVTADHGNDPTIPGTDHTREYVPILAWGHSVRRHAGFLDRMSLVDIGATIAEWLCVNWSGVGRPLEIFL